LVEISVAPAVVCPEADADDTAAKDIYAEWDEIFVGVKGTEVGNVFLALVDGRSNHDYIVVSGRPSRSPAVRGEAPAGFGG
jgi:hypothetical protein